MRDVVLYPLPLLDLNELCIRPSALFLQDRKAVVTGGEDKEGEVNESAFEALHNLKV